MSLTIDSFYSKQKKQENNDKKVGNEEEEKKPNSVEVNDITNENNSNSDSSSSSDSDENITIGDILKEQKEKEQLTKKKKSSTKTSANTMDKKHNSRKQNVLHSLRSAKNDKTILDLKDKIKKDENMITSLQRKQERLKDRLKEIDKAMNRLPIYEVETEDTNLSYFLSSQPTSLSSLYHHNTMKVNALVQIWLHLSIFHNLYSLHITGIHQIFCFYEHLKEYYPSSQQENIPEEASDAMLLYTKIAVKLVQILLKHYREYEVDMKKENDESMKVIQELFDAMKVNESFVNQANWSVIANYLFHSYYCEPDFCTFSPLYSRIQKAFDILSSSECYYIDIKANHLIYILYCLIDMANQTSTIVDEINRLAALKRENAKKHDEEIKQQKKAKGALFHIDNYPKENEKKNDYGKPLTLMQNQFIHQFNTAMLSNNILQLKRMFNQAKEYGMVGGLRNSKYIPAFQPLAKKAQELIATEEKERDSFQRLIDLSCSMIELGVDHIGNYYYLFPHDSENLFIYHRISDKPYYSLPASEVLQQYNTKKMNLNELIEIEKEGLDVLMRDEFEWCILNKNTQISSLLSLLNKKAGKELRLRDMLRKYSILFMFWDPVEEKIDESFEIEDKEDNEDNEMTMVILSYNERFNSFTELLRLFHHYEKNIEDENDSLGQYVRNQIKNCEEWTANSLEKQREIAKKCLFDLLEVSTEVSRVRPVQTFIQQHESLFNQFFSNANREILDIYYSWLSKHLLRIPQFKQLSSKPIKKEVKAEGKKKEEETKRMSQKRSKHTSKSSRKRARLAWSESDEESEESEESESDEESEESEESESDEESEEEEEEMSEEEESEEEEDEWDDTCDICGKGGNLICCDGCTNSYHLRCLRLRTIPKGEWYCPSCSKEQCGVCKKYGLGMHDNIVCGNEDGTKGCGEMFHLSCVGLDDVPDEDWYCKSCRKKYHLE